MNLTPEAIARRRALGIPVHETAAEHEWRADGYCNCGEKRTQVKRRTYLSSLSGQTTGKSNLDVIEQNEDNR